MSIDSQYISDDRFQDILDEQNITGLTDDQQQDLVDRAVGDLEAQLCERFVVPLQVTTPGDFEVAPKFAQQKALNAVISRIRSLLGLDKARNLVIESTQKYIDVHYIDFKGHIKDLLDPKKHYGFQLNSFSVGSFDPVQTIGLARANNETEIILDPHVPLF